MITRRAFFRAALVGAAPLTAAGVIWHDTLAWVIDRSGARLHAMLVSPEQRLRDHFWYLDLDPGGVRQYFIDCRRYLPTFSPRLPLGAEACTRYLLSTDFFRIGADERRRVHYVGFYDPAVTPCNNPLARFDEESGG
jgi:hypothetical protein